MTTTLAKVGSANPTQETKTSMQVVMPPGFEAAPARPIVYVGGETEGGSAFYVWNHDTDSKEWVPIQKFSAQLIDLKTLVKNPDDPQKRSVKLVLEFATTGSGERVALSMGATTYSAMGALAGLSALSDAQLAGEIGLYGKVGKQGRVTFISVYADGALQRNPDSEELLKENRNTDAYLPTVEGIINDIRDRLS